MPDTAITLPFAGANRRFWLTLPGVIEIERRCGRSVFAIYASLGDGEASVLEVCEIIRLGLRAGSDGHINSSEIGNLADENVYPAKPLAEGVLTAWCILDAAIGGIQLKAGKPGSAAEPRMLRKGQLLANCGGMHLDWERLSLSGYFEALEAHNDAHAAEGDKPAREANAEKLAAVMAARTV